MLGFLSRLRPLRPRPLRLAPAAGVDLRCGCQRLRLGGQHETSAPGNLRHRRKAQKQETVSGRIQESAKTLPQYSEPRQRELPAIPPRQNGKRGRIAKTDAHNLWERLKQYETAVLLFAKRPHVSFTNNRAERDLRMSKVKQKVSGCFRTRTFAEAYCRISSYLQTMANKGYNPLLAIHLALSGHLYIQEGE
ncbi:MAG: hypothetical protein EHM56_14240 [Chloroflexi bacterium]|nr:MAG: hypothetical protein EHM56_14240 [Chloroflexota bacterium]